MPCPVCVLCRSLCVACVLLFAKCKMNRPDARRIRAVLPLFPFGKVVKITIGCYTALFRFRCQYGAALFQYRHFYRACRTVGKRHLYYIYALDKSVKAYGCLLAGSLGVLNGLAVEVVYGYACYFLVSAYG